MGGHQLVVVELHSVLRAALGHAWFRVEGLGLRDHG